MRILDHLPPIKMLSKEPCTCIVMPRWHCRGAVQGHCMPCILTCAAALNCCSAYVKLQIIYAILQDTALVSGL